MILLPGCENSDGLISFRVSHKGYSSTGGTLIGKNGTTVECAKQCRKDIGCVAFSYQQIGECYHYHNNQDLTTIQVSDFHKAYVKCNGRLVFFNNICIRIFVSILLYHFHQLCLYIIIYI